MKPLTCEMCGSVDVVKKDGVFVCQHCGTKYSVEEARKMMIEGVVSVQGTVAIDHSTELENLYQAARNARETSDDESAIKHYENISAKDPNSWEALFYIAVLKTNSIKNSEITSSAVSVSNCLPKVFSLIESTISDEDKKKEAVGEVAEQCLVTATWLTEASHNFYKTMTKGNGMIALTGVFGAISSAGSTITALTDDTNRCMKIAEIMWDCGNCIESTFNMEDKDYCEYAVWSWRKLLEFHEDYRAVHSTQFLFNRDALNKINSKLKEYESVVEVNNDEPILTVCFEAKASGAQQLWYSIDGGEKCTLNNGLQKKHYLENGQHVFVVKNPFQKKEYSFVMDGPKTINVYAKSFGMDITE